MLHKYYYKLQEAAKLLNVDFETILQNAEQQILVLSLKHDEYLIDNGTDQINTYQTNIDNCYHVSSSSINMMRYYLNSSIVPYTIDKIELLGSKNRLMSLAEPYKESPVILDSHIVLTHQELTRLLALKAEHDGKPTAKQLQQQLDEANARIDSLEAAQSNDNSEPTAKSKTTINSFFQR
jgi:hypothetical protein